MSGQQDSGPALLAQELVECKALRAVLWLSGEGMSL
jgi:hypothetical protein